MRRAIRRRQPVPPVACGEGRKEKRRLTHCTRPRSVLATHAQHVAVEIFDEEFALSPGEIHVISFIVFDHALRVVRVCSQRYVWEQLCEFGSAGVSGVQEAVLWECPDLFELPVDGDARQNKWVLIVNVNPGGAAGGSGTRYFIGRFDGQRFTSDYPPQKIHYVDHGKDFYAAVTWSDMPRSDGRRILFGWISNWQYANQTPEPAWRGAQSLPRVLTLKTRAEGISLVQQPIAGLAGLRGEYYRWKDVDVAAANASLAAKGVAGDLLEIKAEFEINSAAEFGLQVRKGATEETRIGYEAVKQQMFVDRTRSGAVGFSNQFSAKHAAPLAARGRKVRLHIFVDRSSVEVFGNDGEAVNTDRIFPQLASQGMELFAEGGRATLGSLEIWKLKSAWAGRR